MKQRPRAFGSVALLTVLALTVLALTVLVLTSIAGFGGSSGPSTAELAAQDKQVEAADRVVAAHARLVAVAQRLKRRQLHIALLRARRVRRLRENRRRSVLQSAGPVSDTICAPIREGSRASRHERRLVRRQLLYNLNLRC